jgi:Fe2+ or Zn2+ uptake regulation protein
VLLEVADLRVPAAQRRDFTVESVEVVFRGVCDDCATSAGSA